MTSFGIFDVLITRNTLYSTGVFLLIQDRINHPECKQDFSEYILKHYAVIRKNAEGYARTIKKREVNLSDIYDVFMKMSCAEVDQVRYLMEMEIQAELENVTGIEKNIALLKARISDHEKVALITDTYFSSDQIRSMLWNVDKEIADLPIYVSNEYGQTKRSGDLYLALQHDMGVPFSQWEHYGNDFVSDKRIPEAMGIQAICLKAPEPMQWENKLAAEGKIEGDLVHQVYLGALKKIRAKYTMNTAQKIGSTFGGCLLYPYVWRIIQVSIKEDYKRLYFIARDGYILKKIADIIIEAYGYQIQTKYIYGSRKAWRENSDDEAKRLLLCYLTQVVDFSDEKFAFIDLQGTGYSVECISNTVEPVYDRPLNVFYYYYFPEKECTLCNVIPFLCLDNGNLLEPFARAPHGTTLGYKCESENVEPIIAETNQKIWEQAGLKGYNQGVELFSEALTNILKKMQLSGDNPSIAIWLVDYLKHCTDSELSEFIGEIPHNNTIEDTKSVFAPKLNAKDIFLLYMWRTSEDMSVYYKGTNYQMSLARLNPNEKSLISFFEKNYYKFLGRFLHKIKYVFAKKIKLPSYKKIVIYAAGQAGRRLYNYIKYETTSRIVGWTDIQYEAYQNQGYPVVSLQDVLKTEYDVIVIAIENRVIRENVEVLLTALGADGEKVKMLGDFYMFIRANDNEK